MTKLPSRLHHTAYVTKDLEATRHFYEDILGFPLVATEMCDPVRRRRLTSPRAPALIRPSVTPAALSFEGFIQSA